MRPSRRQVLWTCAGTPLIAAPLVYASRHLSKPRNFGVVREGVLYRSGQLTPVAFNRALTDYRIHTVVSLRPVRDEEAKADTWEEGACRERGVRHVRVWPTDATGDAFLNRMAAGFLAVTDDPDNFPILVHCVAGRDRTGTVCAVYRMENDGWTPERAAAEMREYEFDPDKDAAAGAYWRFVLRYQTRARRVGAGM